MVWRAQDLGMGGSGSAPLFSLEGINSPETESGRTARQSSVQM